MGCGRGAGDVEGAWRLHTRQRGALCAEARVPPAHGRWRGVQGVFPKTLREGQTRGALVDSKHDGPIVAGSRQPGATAVQSAGSRGDRCNTLTANVLPSHWRTKSAALEFGPNAVIMKVNQLEQRALRFLGRFGAAVAATAPNSAGFAGVAVGGHSRFRAVPFRGSPPRHARADARSPHKLPCG